jgi:hypothetical protein
VPYQPFSAATAAQLAIPWGSGSSVVTRNLVAVEADDPDPADKTYVNNTPDMPPAAQMTNLFSPITQVGGLGQPQARFLPRYFGSKYTTITC